MQLARHYFLTREKTYIRKFNEILLSLKIEREFSKQEILELYLNTIYLGQRAYGVGSAAQVYYGADINDLSLPQIAMIAGLPKAPSTTNPVSNPERAMIRRNYVLSRLLEKGYINEGEYLSAMNAPITASLHKPAIEVEAPYVAEMVRKRVIAGTVDQVVKQILELRSSVGPFGTLLYTGHDWMDPPLARRSMELMAKEVMPSVNAALQQQK